MARNVLGTELESCCTNPMTGFYRNGKCDTDSDDHGMHTVCVLITESFLDFCKQVGNDLQTPIPGMFPGLKEGDKWCLCMERWKEAYEHSYAPLIFLESTHISVLEHVDLKILKDYAVV